MTVLAYPGLARCRADLGTELGGQRPFRYRSPVDESRPGPPAGGEAGDHRRSRAWTECVGARGWPRSAADRISAFVLGSIRQDVNVLEDVAEARAGGIAADLVAKAPRLENPQGRGKPVVAGDHVVVIFDRWPVGQEAKSPRCRDENGNGSGPVRRVMCPSNLGRGL